MLHERSGKVVVFCENASSLFRIAAALNELGYYSVSLCSSIAELTELLEQGRRFEYLIFDDFDLVLSVQHLKLVAEYAAVSSVVTVSDVNSQQRKCIFQWARSHEIPLTGVLQAPFRLLELEALIGRGAPTILSTLREKRVGLMI